MYQTFFKVYEFDGEEMAVEELVSRDFGIIHYLSPLAISIILTTYENLSLKIANTPQILMHISLNLEMDYL